MHLWVEIVARELAMLLTLLALGSGPASYLGRRFDPASRLAMAAALGMCLGTCVFTTLIWFTAAANTYWLIPVMAVVSVAVALRRGRTAAAAPGEPNRPRWASWRPRPSDALALALVCVVVAAPLSYTLHERGTVGPTGFLIADAAGYTAETDGAVQESIQEAEEPAASKRNVVDRDWGRFATSVQNIDAVPLSANVNEFLGLSSTETQSPFLIAFLIVGALGAFAAVRYTAPKPAWAAPLAGVLFAGPLFLQLLADGSQAAICGIALMLPIAIVGAETLRQQRFADLALLALLSAGLMALYPLYVPAVAITGALMLLAIALHSQRHGRLSRQALRLAAARVATVVGLTILFNVVSAIRNVAFWDETLTNTVSRLPQYKLPLEVLPGWLFQTRQFFFLTNLAHVSAYELLLGAILPAIFIAVMVAGIWRRRSPLIVLTLLLVLLALTAYSAATKACPYCVDRNLLPVAPLLIALLTLGVAALATAPSRWLRWIGVVVAMAAVAATANQTRTERLLFAADSYFLDSGNRTLLNQLPPHAGPVDLEGYGQDPAGRAPIELPLVFILASELDHGEVSRSNEYEDYNAFITMKPDVPTNAGLEPGYRYVLTRFGGVQSGRRTIARAGPLALEERVAPLDAMVISGVATPLVRLDEQGYARVVGSLHMLVIGGGAAPSWIRLRFHTLTTVSIPSQPGVRVRSAPNTLTVCVPARGSAPVRQASLELEGALSSGVIPRERFAEPEPPGAIQLVAMQAVTSCSP